jgi:hypothetical protein
LYEWNKGRRGGDPSKKPTVKKNNLKYKCMKTSERYEVARTSVVIPARCAARIWCSVTGLHATGSIGLGISEVIGAKRVPRPPTSKIPTVMGYAPIAAMMRPAASFIALSVAVIATRIWWLPSGP